jgi:hypothetical protein
VRVEQPVTVRELDAPRGTRRCRYDRRADIHEAFLALGYCLIGYRRLSN